MILFTSGQRVGTTLLHESLLKIDPPLERGLIHFHFVSKTLEWFFNKQEILSHLIILRRKNKIRQAISLWKATMSLIYHCRNDKELERFHKNKYTYDFETIKEWVQCVEDMDERIDHLSRDCTLPRLNLFYEDMQTPKKLITTMRNIFSFVGRDIIVPDDFQAPTFKTADATSEEYYQQYLIDLKGKTQCNSKDLDALIGV